MTFADLGLSDELLRSVSESGYDEPTPIQRAAIPSVLMGKDLIGIAQTGTGKTASFVLPMLDILHQGRSRARMPRSLILEPTRELAQQVSENFDKYGKYHPLSMALLIGGVQMGDQIKALEKGVDVLIDIDTQGAATIRSFDDSIVRQALADIFIMPPDVEELRRRLMKRGTETAQQIESRLATAMREMELWRDYRYTIVSGSVEEDLENVRNIISAETFLSKRLTPN